MLLYQRLLLFLIFSVSSFFPFKALSLETGNGLLFYLSGDGPGDGFTADYASGDPEPAYLNEYTLVADGAHGKAFSAPHSEQKLMAYLAPGNIYAERGTLSFFWRSRDPVGGMPFKIFYVSYCDHSSLDMTWLRIDYNGEEGFDAFVTDANMARIRVSYKPAVFPEPDRWTHFAFTWDETEGVRLFIDGTLTAHKDTTTLMYAGLGLFNPHGRFATPGTVTSNCGHLRGGDIDEIHIFDRALSGKHIKRLADGETPDDVPVQVRGLSNPVHLREWLYRYGWDNPDKLPPCLDAGAHSIRKVEIHDARDQKKWSWRCCDGIRETTWPDVYNRSRLPGRSDYFIEPDWYCYSTSGKSITFTMPDEPWNYCEITGAAFGTVTLVSQDSESRKYSEQRLFSRPESRERTFHTLADTFFGGEIRYENDIRETPLAEFQVYHVERGTEPEGAVKLHYTLTADTEPDYPSLDELVDYIGKRFLPDERRIMVGLPARSPRKPKVKAVSNPLPLVHVIIPFQFRDEGPRTNRGAYAGFHYTWENISGGLDGIAIDIPAFDVKATHGDYFPMNIQIKDPLWPNRNMIDFSFCVKPGEPKTLWFDMRDRILPDNRSFYITFAGAGTDFGMSSLEGARVRLVFKEREKAIAEHELDRFTQIRDNFAANMSETGPKRKKLEHYERFSRDIKDLFKVNPNHIPGRYYWSSMNPEQGWPPYEQPEAPPGVPLWAFRQTEIVKQWKYFLNWWIDNRQIGNGEFGGGLSDDGDFANCMPGLALMGVNIEKITDSLHRLMEAYYENGMFTNGLNTILTDALHATEEGINVQSELMLLEYGDPKLIERMLETSSRYRDIAGINTAGHRHFQSSFFSSTKMATENPWCWSSRFSHTILYPGINLVEYNGHPAIIKIIVEIGDGILAHAVTDNNGQTTLPMEINFLTDEARLYSNTTALQMFTALNRWTGDGKYVSHMGDRGADEIHRYDKQRLEESYAGVIRYNAQRMYMGTEGFPWDDGPYISYGTVLIDRLGGVPVRRANQLPEHVISWSFNDPHSGENIAILVPESSGTSLKIIAYNLTKEPIIGTMTGWNVDPGIWEVTEGTDNNSDDLPDSIDNKYRIRFERTEGIDFTFPPHQTSVIQMKLKKKGTPYWKRPDLGIGRDDVHIFSDTVSVTVHNLGSVDSPPCTVALIDYERTVVSSAEVSALKAPLDYLPKTEELTMSVPAGTKLDGYRIVIDPAGILEEITRLNNEVTLP